MSKSIHQGGSLVQRVRRRGFGLTAKVMIAPLLILSLFVVVSAISVTGFRDVQSTMEEVTGELAPDTALATDILTNLFQQRLRLNAFIATRNPAIARKFAAQNQALGTALEKARTRITGGERRQTLNKLIALREKYTRAFDERIHPAAAAVDKVASDLAAEGEKTADALNKLASRGIDANDYIVAYQAQRASGRINALRALAQRYAGTRNPDQLKAARALVASTGKDLKDLNDYVFGDQQEKLLAQAVKAHKAYAGTLDELASKLEVIDRTMAQVINPVGEQLDELAKALQKNAFGSLKSVADSANANAGSTVRLSLVLMVAAGVVGLLVAFFITRGVVRPVIRGRDEITALLEDMESGRADLSRRLTTGGSDEVGAFIASVNRFLEALNEVVSGIGRETESLARASEQLTSVTASTKNGLDQQRNDVEQVAAAMNELAATAQEIARNTAEAAGYTESVSKDGARGRQVVQDTVEAIDSLSGEVESAAARVSELREEAGSVGRVLDVIREVAEQTNLLALNAAIEAARAGEAGRGFAVVADEVRTLASRTQESTGEINDIIERLRQGAEGATGAMENTLERTRETVERAAAAGDALSRISEGVGHITDMTAQIAGAAEEQTATGESINQSVTRVNSVVEESVAGVEQVERASRDLAAMSERLQDLVARFRGELSGT